jgi:DNA-binding beta-propeller fold protein YncE
MKLWRSSVVRLLMVGLVVALIVPASGAAASQTYTGSVSATGTKWNFRTFSATQGDTITVSLDWADTSANLGLYLYKPDGTSAARSTSAAKPKTITYTATSTGTWKFGVKALAGSSTYTATVDTTTGTSGTSFTFTGSLDASGTKLAVHSFTVSAPASITVNLDWDNAGANLTLFLKNPGGSVVASSTSSAKPKTITYQATTSGTWKINVKAASGAASYTATVQLGTATTVAKPVHASTLGNGQGEASMYPSGLDVDPSGNLYIADTGNDQVAAYAPDGSQLWRAGVRGPKANGTFQNPRDLAYLNGKVYVADTEYNRVQVLDATSGHWLSTWSYRFTSILGISAGVDATGNPIILTSDDAQNTISLFTPTGTLIRQYKAALGNANGQLNAPRDAATDSSGDIYVADFANNRMVEFSPTFTFIRAWGSKGTAAGQFNRPYGVALDAANNVYVADSDNERIEEFTSTGTFIRQMGSAGTGNGQFFQLRRVAVGSGTSPQVYGADLWGFHVSRFSNTGSFQQTYGGVGPADGGFNEPSGEAVGANDTYVADSVNQRIQKFATSSGAFEQVIGHRGWLATDLLGMNWPRDVTLNGVSNTIWVADTKNNRLTEFNTQGNPTGKKAGKLGSGTDQLHWPFAIDSAGADVIVADTFNNRIERWDTGTLTTTWTSAAGVVKSPKDLTVVGNTVYVADTGDNRVVELDATTGALIKSFGSLHGPQGIAVDASGNIWVSDTNQNRLVEFSPAGSVLQTFGSLGAAHGQFNYPTKLEITGTTLSVCDTYNNRVENYTIG